MRKLTGKWYLKPRIWGGFKVMVQVTVNQHCSITGDSSPQYSIYEKAKAEDIIELGINIGNQ